MEKEALETLYLKDITCDKLYKLFRIKCVNKIEELNDWLTNLPVLNKQEVELSQFYSKNVRFNISDWNKQELLMNFVGPILYIIDFTQPYQLGLFASRSIFATVEDYRIEGVADFFWSNNTCAPDLPFYGFGAVRPEITVGDENIIGRVLAAMLVGQAQNKAQDKDNDDEVIYGCYVVGRLWYFMVLKGKEFAISKDYSATHDDDILNIVRILKALRSILFARLGIDEATLIV